MSIEHKTESLCHTCFGMCCRGNTWIELSTEEAQQMETKGTRLVGALVKIFPDKFEASETVGEYPQIVEKNRRWARRHGRQLGDAVLANIVELSTRPSQYEQKLPYYMESDCANLDTSGYPIFCKLIGDPQRPEVCVEFEGGEKCVALRKDARLDTPVELTIRPRGTRPPIDSGTTAF